MPVIQITDGRSALWQWDTGVKIRILGCCSVQQCHFPTAAGLIARDAVDNVCAVPDAALQTAGTLKVYAYSRNEDGGVTMNEFSLPVNARPKPADYIDPPDEMDSLDQIVQRVVDRIGDISGGIVEEKDPTVPDWAKQPEPPKYTAQDVGALPVDAIKASASGAVVSVTDAAARPAVGLVSQIVAVQEGEGDPSPDNVRPIRGWNKAGVKRTGKNLIDGMLRTTPQITNGVEIKYIPEEDVYYLNGTVDSNTSYYFLPRLIAPATGRVSLTVDYVSGSVSVPSGGYAVYYIGKANNATSSDNFVKCDLQNNNTRTEGKSIDQRYIFSDWFYLTKGVVFDNYKCRIMVELSPTATPYEPYTDQKLTADLPETVYGGNLDWVTGVLTVTHDANGVELAQPYTIQLTPQQLDMLKGANNIWSDTGDTDLVYVADLQMYIDQRIAAIAAAVVGQ